MAAYRRVYDSRHPQADCYKNRDQPRNPTVIEYGLPFICVCRVFFRDDGCDGKTTLGVTAELYCDQHVDVYVGMPCSAGQQPQRSWYQ